MGWWGPWNDGEFIGFVVCGCCSLRISRPFDEASEKDRAAREADMRARKAKIKA
jgi:hypothetical protein